MADKTRVTVSESFTSQNEEELCKNVQRLMEEYAALCAKSCSFSPFSEKGAERE